MGETGNRTRANSVAALERASGRPWCEWLQIFERHGAASLGHAEIARIARAAMPDDLQNPDWWAQGAAIAFEQHAGLRVPGQASDGTFRVSASRTLAGDRDAAIDAWDAMMAGAGSHRGCSFGEPRRSRTEKRSFWRATLEGVGRFEAAAEAKGDDRVSLSLSLTDMTDGAEIEQWRAHWKEWLARL